METTETPPRVGGPSLSFEGKRDPVRGVDMVDVRVENTVRNLTVPHGHLIQPGTVEFRCYADDLPAIESLVETRMDMVVVAREAHENHIMAEARSAAENPDDPDDMKRAVKLVQETTGNSVESEFRRITGRDILPLRGEVKVIRNNIPEPKRQDEFKSQTALTQSFAEVMQETILGNLDARIEAEVEKRLAEKLKKKG